MATPFGMYRQIGHIERGFCAYPSAPRSRRLCRARERMTVRTKRVKALIPDGRGKGAGRRYPTLLPPHRVSVERTDRSDPRWVVIFQVKHRVRSPLCPQTERVVIVNCESSFRPMAQAGLRLRSKLAPLLSRHSRDLLSFTRVSVQSSRLRWVATYQARLHAPKFTMLDRFQKAARSMPAASIAQKPALKISSSTPCGSIPGIAV